jgi:hypothetical protein
MRLQHPSRALTLGSHLPAFPLKQPAFGDQHFGTRRKRIGTRHDLAMKIPSSFPALP